jgi:hypothetical protein
MSNSTNILKEHFAFIFKAQVSHDYREVLAFMYQTTRCHNPEVQNKYFLFVYDVEVTTIRNVWISETNLLFKLGKSKNKVIPILSNDHGMKTNGEVDVQLHVFLDFALRGNKWLASGLTASVGSYRKLRPLYREQSKSICPVVEAVA